MSNQPPKVSEDEISRVGKLLNLTSEEIQEKWPAFSSLPNKCSTCGEVLDFYDFVKTAYDSGIHTPEYMKDFFLGDGSMEKEMEIAINCSKCNSPTDVVVLYKYNGPRICS